MTGLRSRSGMTLIEALVTASILSMMLITAAAMLIHSIRGWSSGSSRDAATGRATIALQKLSKEIRGAKSASVVSGALVVTFPMVLEDPTTHERVYDPGASDPTVRRYFVSSGNLVRQIQSSETVLGRGVSAVTFGASGGTVSVTLTTTDQVGRFVSQTQVSGRVALRNWRTL